MRPILALAIACSAAIAWAASSAQAQTTTVTVIHGINGTDLGLDESLPVDVHVSGVGCALTGFAFRQISDRLELPSGSYDIRIHLADPMTEPCGGSVAVDAPGVEFEDGTNSTVIAHLDADGAPTATKFDNDLSLGEPGDGRVALHHTAAAPAVDVRLERRFWLRNAAELELQGVENRDSADADLFRGIYLASIAPAGQEPIFYQFLRVRQDFLNAVYVVGSAGNGSLELLFDHQDQVDVIDPQDMAGVTVIHGIPGKDLGLDPALPVDIYVDGLGCVLEDVIFGAISDRLAVPPGDYDIEVRLAADDVEPCEGGTAISAPAVPFAPGERATVIAHLTEGGAIQASKFTNDLSAPDRYWKGRASIHHLAAAPAVDVAVWRRSYWWFNRVLALFGVVNGDAADADLWRGDYVVKIAPAGGRPIFGAELDVVEGEAARVYAVGSLANDTFTLIVDRQALDR
jgi:hypothetical protein